MAGNAGSATPAESLRSDVVRLADTSGDRHRYRPEDLEILTFVSSQVAMAIERKTREAQLQLVQAAVDGARDAL